MIDGPPSLDNTKEGIIKHNLSMMNTRMLQMIVSESLNGNAGVAQTESGLFYSSAVANGRVDNNGSIIAFDNLQNVPEKVVGATGAFSFHVTFDKDFGVHKIIFLYNKSGISEEVMKILRESIAQFNGMQKKE